MLLMETGGTPWEPFDEVRRLQSDLNRLFDGGVFGARRRGDPPVNLWTGEDSLVATVEAPGAPPESVELSLAENMLTIRGERREARQDDGVRWLRRERPAGGFSRTVSLPFAVDAERAQARAANGMIEIELPRAESDRPRRIEIAAQ